VSWPMLEFTTVLTLLLVSPAARGSEPSTDSHRPLPRQACTSSCLEHEGSCVFGTNLDFPYSNGQVFVNKRNVVKTGIDASTTGKRARWISKYGSVTFNMMGYQFAWAGMNEAGLVGSSMHLQRTQLPAPDARPPLQLPLWLQYQLDNFATVKEMLAGEAAIRPESGDDHFLLCDRTGACASIEFLGGRTVSHTGRSMPVKVLANGTYEESVRDWRSRVYEGDYLARFVIAADLVTSYTRQVSNGRRSARLPAANADAGAVHYSFYVQSSVSRQNTAWTIVFDGKNQRVYFTTQRNPRIRWVDLRRLDFSRRTPVRMLDVQAELEGDVTDRLAEYSHELSLAHTYEAFHTVAPGEADDATLAAVIEKFESFPYADADAE
jgi:penicillin V acylase-like amidase (Ntn superfamily)